MLTMTYIHNHVCEREGHQHVVRPPSVDGVALVPSVLCEEAMTELRLVKTERE